MAAMALLIIAAGLNLNGFLSVLTGQSQLMTVVYAFASITLLIASKPAFVFEAPIFQFIFAIIGYIGLGTFFGGLSSQPVMLGYVFTYGGSTLIITGVASYVAQANSKTRDWLITFAKNVFVISAVATLLSPVLNTQLQLMTVSSRNSGLFSNPNEAGMAAAIGALLVLSTAQRSKLWWLELSITTAACLTTLSRSAGLALFFVFLFYGLKSRNWFLIVMLLALLGLGGVIVSLVIAYDTSLTPEQIYRLSNILSLFQGEVSSNTVGSRLDLVQIGIDRISQIFPSGDGLGSFHFLIGSQRSADLSYWLGVHNTYLMILGEAGVVGFLLFLYANFTWLIAIARKGTTVLQLGYFAILQVHFWTAHDTLGVRFQDVMLGLTLGLLLQSHDRKSISLRKMGKNSKPQFVLHR